EMRRADLPGQLDGVRHPPHAVLADDEIVAAARHFGELQRILFRRLHLPPGHRNFRLRTRFETARSVFSHATLMHVTRKPAGPSIPTEECLEASRSQCRHRQPFRRYPRGADTAAATRT